jgi:allophanate hydrolase
MDWLSMDVRSLETAYATGTATPTLLVGQFLNAAVRPGYEVVWISKFGEDKLRARASELEKVAAETGIGALPLYGVLVAVKDNIDVAGLPTTAACPAFAYQPQRSAEAVLRLERAGAIIVGKTNLDQFATGLVGVRSPYGEVPNAFDPRYLAGGSSAGSAVAVALGQVHLALGTDTAGSGRVPAAMNNIVGLKPSRDLISTEGLVPACRSLDCISIFSRTVDDAVLGLAALVAGRGEGEGTLEWPAAAGPGLRLAMPGREHLALTDDPLARRAFDVSLEALKSLGVELVPVDFSSFVEAAALLYEGPFVAERLEAAGHLLAQRPQDLDPVVASVVSKGLEFSAQEAFAALHKVALLKKRVSALLDGFEALVVPSIPRFYTREELRADPFGPNSHLGIYTNGVNLLDLCALAVPTGFREDGLPAGVTLIAPAMYDLRLAALARCLQESLRIPLGATGLPFPLPRPAPETGLGPRFARIAVVGAHRRGMPLNGQLTGLGAILAEVVRTAPEYRLYRLPGTEPPKPALVRVPGGGTAIELEIWQLPLKNFGAFVAMVPPPLGIGTVLLGDGRSVQCFICEGYALEGAEDITRFGSWTQYMATLTR